MPTRQLLERIERAEPHRPMREQLHRRDVRSGEHATTTATGNSTRSSSTGNSTSGSSSPGSPGSSSPGTLRTGSRPSTQTKTGSRCIHNLWLPDRVRVTRRSGSSSRSNLPVRRQALTMPVDSTKLLVIGGIGVGAYLFRAQLSSMLGLSGATTTTGTPVDPIAAAKATADALAAAGLNAQQQAAAAQQAATAAAAAAKAKAAQDLQQTAFVKVQSAIAQNPQLPAALSAMANASGPAALARAQSSYGIADGHNLLNTNQWNYYLVQSNPSAAVIDQVTSQGDNLYPASVYVGLRQSLGLIPTVS